MDKQYSSIGELIESRSAENPEKMAITYLRYDKNDNIIENRVSYKDLELRSKKVAYNLSFCTQKGDRVLILCEPGLEYIYAFFGCVFAGLIAVPSYVPYSSRLLSTISSIVNNSKLKTVLTSDEVKRKIKTKFSNHIEIDSLNIISLDEIYKMTKPSAYTHNSINPDSIAFLQYTSGSTSQPKGVMVSHGNLLNNLNVLYKKLDHSKDTKMVSWLPPYHDMGLIYGIMQPIYGNFPVYLISPLSFLAQPFRWLQAISKYRATSSGAPNFAYELCINKIDNQQKETLDLSSWEIALNGAEPVRAATLKRFSKFFKANGFREEAFYPAYGLAEATLIVSGGSSKALPVIENFYKKDIETNIVSLVFPESPNSTPIVGCGKAFKEETIRIVDPATYTVLKDDHIGEIWLNSSSVTQGYWNNPDETESTFRAYTKDGQGPFLRTGDLGFLKDAELYITGRIKDLIIIKGKNYYPQDIELTVEKAHDAIRKGSTIAFSIDANNEENLVVVSKLKKEYFGLTQNKTQYVISKISKDIDLNHELDVFDVVLIKSDTIPKTSSGKLRRAFCKKLYLEGELRVFYSYVNDQAESTTVSNELFEIANVKMGNKYDHSENSDVEMFLCKFWKKLLKLNEIGSAEDFFELGGNSLKIVSLISMIHKEFKVKLSIRDVFKNPTIKELSRLIKASDEVIFTPIEPADQQEYYVQSSAQKRLFLLNRLMNVSTAYNISAGFRISENIDKDKLETAFLKLIERHESLRTSFDIKNDVPVQIIHEAIDFKIDPIEIHGKITDSAIQNAINNFIGPFCLETAPLFRVGHIKITDTDHILIIDIDHIICDGSSMNLLIRDLVSLYNEDALPPLNIQYKDFTVWQNRKLESGAIKDQASYWFERLSGELPVLELPTDFPRPDLITFNGDKFSFELDSVLTKGIRDVALKNGATLYMTLLAIYNVLLSKYSGQQDIIIGSPTAGRNHPDTDDIIGMFLNTLAMRNFPQPEKAFDAFLQDVKQNTLNAFENQDYQFDDVVNYLEFGRNVNRNPIFDTTFVLQNMDALFQDLGDAKWAPYKITDKSAKYDLGLSCTECDDRLAMELEYNINLYKRGTIENLCSHFVNIAKAVVADSSIKIQEIPLVRLDEQSALLFNLNNTQAVYPRDKTIHEIFEDQVTRSPDNVAVSFGETKLTYRELNDKSNQLARVLRNKGLMPDTVVSIMVERSPEMIIGLLGTLKAGGAYLLIDPEYPAERVSYMLEDSQSMFLLTQTHLMEKLKCQAGIIDLNDERLYTQDSNNLGVVSKSNDLLYVVYTSGSTGKPKGVTITHRNGINLIFHMFNKTNIPFSEKKNIIHFASISFDVTFQEIFSALLSGGELIIISDALRKDILGYFSMIEKEAIEIVFLPISYIKLVFSEDDCINRFPSTVKHIVIGGDQLVISKSFRDFVKQRKIFIHNHYGPSETHVVTTLTIDPEGDIPTIPPIGKPISNTQIYILSDNNLIMPVNVVGELCISGDCVGRGYLNREALTSEKFVINPFIPDAIMYRSGDKARWLPDGNIEFMGRVDRQVKIRGYRVELGEIEAVLLEHSAVKNVAVVGHIEKNGNKALVAHIVPDYSYLLSNTETLVRKWQNSMVSEWRKLFNFTWEQSSVYKDKKFNLTGWNSSYTDESISEEEMRVWVDDTAESIISLKPERVLEIGCGTGLILSRVAPYCKSFLGTDFSEDSIRYCQEQLLNTYKDLAHAEVLHQEADNFDVIQDRRFDAIILNSVIQYFPSIDYLERTLARALKLIDPGGFIFLGDVRSYPLMKAFHTSVQLFKADSVLSTKELIDRIHFQMNEEMEFLVDPEYFLTLRDRYPGISNVSILPKRGRYKNELTKFRYQVIINTASDVQADGNLSMVSLDWQKDIGSILDLFSTLKDKKYDVIRVEGVPGSRLHEERLAMFLLDQKSEIDTVGQLKGIISSSANQGVDIEDIYDIGIKSGYTVDISWVRQNEENCYDVIFKSKDAIDTGCPSWKYCSFDYAIEPKPLSRYVNIPMKGRFFRHLMSELRTYLQSKLPDYMIPSFFMQSESLPLTSTGKIDRNSLPVPNFDFTQNSNYVLAEDETEKKLAAIWTKVLGIEKIGINDTFFDLGGDSIKAIQIVSRLESVFNLKIPIITLFQYTTIRSLADYLNHEKPETHEADSKFEESMTIMENTINVLSEQDYE